MPTQKVYNFINIAASICPHMLSAISPGILSTLIYIYIYLHYLQKLTSDVVGGVILLLIICYT